ncbi:MAG: radical SAM protein [Bacteroidota bacterium]
MSLEVRPLGVKCNLHCQYCYQNPERDAGNVLHKYDLDAMVDTLEQEDDSFTLFGGEPLLMPLPDLERLFALGYAKHGENGIQTNGTLVTDEHIALFKKYRVGVGVSLDGPGSLNDARWAGTLDKTRLQTAKAEAAIEKLCAEGVPTSLIITLHQANANPDALPILGDWLHHLEVIGVESVRLHLLEVDDPAIGEKYSLTPEDNLRILRYFEALEAQLPFLHLDVFGEMRAMLQGEDEQASCVWRACDPYTTEAVQGLEGNGQRSNCGRTNKDGVSFVKSNKDGYERYLALYLTPQSAGGCSDCRFFLMCKGQCPGTSIDGDWRNRTADCETWKQLFIYLEKRLQEEDITPLSLSPLRQHVENFMLQAWAQGNNPSVRQALSMLHGQMNSQPA